MEIQSSQDPIELFKEWLALASKTEDTYPEAMSLATVNAEGQPSARTMLLKAVNDEGFSFYTNMKSRKNEDLAENPKAGLCFHWKSQKRQVLINGHVKLVPDVTADEYFKSRDYLSKVGAWASHQSEELASRAELEARVEEYKAKFKDGEVPRPPHWSGYILVPEQIEFWQEGEARLHDRFLFSKTANSWDLCRLNP